MQAAETRHESLAASTASSRAALESELSDARAQVGFYIVFDGQTTRLGNHSFRQEEFRW